jgi:DNA polymerase III delta prime subunit
MTNDKEFLFVEKYRPRTISECILPEDLKNTFTKMVNSGEIPNMMLSGPAGTGKTTVAKALCAELGSDHIMINCSENGNIDTLRTKIRQFASTISLTTDKPKVVILDEFDYSNAQSIQPALRGAIEEFSANCRFILTCNYKSRIIEPLHSRCPPIDFIITNKEKPKICAQMFERCEEILKQESIEFDKKTVAQLILKYFPDFRRVLNEIQRYSVSGKIDEGILTNISDNEIKIVIDHMKKKNFADVRKWVAANVHLSESDIFQKLYDNLYDFMTPSSIPQAILVIAEYQYKSSFAANQEINMVACLIEIMMSCEFK